MQFCRGKIEPVVAFKLHGHEQEDVVEKTMTVLQQYNFIEHCLFMSLEYTLVENIQTNYPQAIAGYCIYGNVGDINPVYVWTVNNPGNMKHYLKLGVNGLFTDYPDVGKQVIEEYKQSSDSIYMQETAWSADAKPDV